MVAIIRRQKAKAGFELTFEVLNEGSFEQRDEYHSRLRVSSSKSLVENWC